MEKEKPIKRWWLTILIFQKLYILMTALFLIYKIQALSLIEQSIETKTLLENTTPLIISLFILFFPSSILAFILYACSYRKPGTKFLTFFLVCAFLYIPRSIYSMIELNSLLNLFTNIEFSEHPISILYNIEHIIFISLGFISTIAFLVLSFKLIDINKKKKIDSLNLIQEYQNLFQHMQTSTNSEELYLRYGECVRKYPQFASLFKKVYKEKNSQLSSQ